MHNRHSLRRLLVALLSGIFAFFCAVFAAVLCVPLPLDRIRTYPVSPFVMDRHERPLAIRLSGASEIPMPPPGRLGEPSLPFGHGAQKIPCRERQGMGSVGRDQP